MNSVEKSLQQNRRLNSGFKRRNESGAGIIAIGLFLAFFAVLPLSLLYFEMARFGLMQQELHNITDFAALSGTAALASQSGGGIGSGQTAAMQQAVITFAQNSILETGFGPTPANAQLSATHGAINNITYDLNDGATISDPTATKSVNLNVTLRDQNGVPQATGSATAVTMAVDARFRDSTIFASQILPIQNTIVAAAFSLGGLPQLDMILCFDVSGSMDDATTVYLVKRTWNGAGAPIPTGTGAIVCTTVTTSQGGSSTPDTIYNIFKPAYTGTAFNIVPPQGLRFGSFPQSFAGVPAGQGVTYPYIFTESPFDPNTYPNANALSGLRANFSVTATNQTLTALGDTEQGLPPGDYSPGNNTSNLLNGVNPLSAAYQYYFTDCIPSALVGVSTGGFNFADIPTCVEASRGNLENPQVYASSLANTDCPSAAVGPGWYNAYWNWIINNATPISVARTAAQTFFQTMNASSNGHFGIVTFATTIGSTAGSTVNNGIVDATYPQGGNNNYPLPLVALSPTISNYDATNATGVTAAIVGSGSIPPLGPLGQTDIADALSSAVGQLTNVALTRPAAKKAIIVFTDGVPNVGTNNATPDYGAFAVASSAGIANIPVFTIGLSQNSTIQPYEQEVLGDGNEPILDGKGSQGIAYKSGNLATYYPVNGANSLNSAFQAVARSLVVLQ